VVALGVTFAMGVVVATGAGACGDWGVPVAAPTGVAAGADVAGEPADDADLAEAADADGAALGVLGLHADTPSVRPRLTAAAAIPGAIRESRFRFMMCPLSWR
jgi:hypothetical protein